MILLPIFSPTLDQHHDLAKPPILRNAPLVPGMNNEIFTLEEGQAALQWPKNLSKDSFEDLEAWLKLIVKKAKRVSEKQETPIPE